MRARPLIALLGSALLLLATACAASSSTSSAGIAATGSGASGRFEVVATTTLAADFARRVGGDRVEVTSLLKPNVDADDFEPSPADIELIARAGLIAENGVGLESWLQPTIEAAGSQAPVVDLSEGVALRQEADDDGAADPHIWQNPRNVVQMVANLAQGLEQADPDGAATYRANRDRYTADLAALDQEVEAAIAPLTNKKVVTNHDAFGYYLDRYGLTFVGAVIPSSNSTAELSAGDLEDLVAAIRAEGAKAVFSETSIGPKTAESIADQAGVKVVAGEDALYGDSLGPEGSDASDYVAMIRHNTKVFVENLR